MISAPAAFIISSTRSSTLHDVVETLVGRIMAAIRARAEHQQTYCVYDVPVWMPGFACYDIHRVKTNVIRVLLTLGYHVQQQPYHQLHISWKHANPERTRPPPSPAAAAFSQQHATAHNNNKRETKTKREPPKARNKETKTVVVLT